MNHQKIVAFLLVAIAMCWRAVLAVGPGHAESSPAVQNVRTGPDDTQFNALNCLTSAFPKSVTIKKNGHLLEFCPDNTCDGFVSSSDVPVAELRDFAYLYIYYFSDFTYLSGWRNSKEARNAAERVLSKSEYGDCKGKSARQTARCALLGLTRKGRIKLIFVRYDENQRNVVPVDIRKELAERER